MPTVFPIRSSQNASTVLAAAHAAAASTPDLISDFTFPSMDSPKIFNQNSSSAHLSPSASRNQMPLIPSSSLSPLPFFLAQELPQILEEDNNKIPDYKMCRYLESVKDTWREWIQGLVGFSPVQDLEGDFGCKGRLEQKEKAWFGGRKVLIDYIKFRVNQEVSQGRRPEEVILELDTWQKSQKGSLDWLIKEIKREKKARGWSRKSVHSIERYWGCRCRRWEYDWWAVYLFLFTGE